MRNDLAFNVPVYILRRGGVSQPLWLIPCKAVPIFGDSVGRTSNGANEVYFLSCLWWQYGKTFRVETGKNVSHPLPGTTVGFLHSFSFWCFPLMYFFFLASFYFIQFKYLLKSTASRPSRWWKSKTWRSPSSPQIHQKYMYMWKNSYKTPAEHWQKTSDFPKGQKLPMYLVRAK